MVFAVLSLVVRDPVFSNSAYKRRYRCPRPTIKKGRIRSLIPMLYHSKFDPNSTISEVCSKNIPFSLLSLSFFAGYVAAVAATHPAPTAKFAPSFTFGRNYELLRKLLDQQAVA